MKDNMDDLEYTQDLSNGYKVELMNDGFDLSASSDEKKEESIVEEKNSEDVPVHVETIDKKELYNRLGITEEPKTEEKNKDEIVHATKVDAGELLKELATDPEKAPPEPEEQTTTETFVEEDAVPEMEDIKEDVVPEMEDVKEDAVPEMEDIKEDVVPEMEDVKEDAVPVMEDVKEDVVVTKHEPEKFIELKINKDVLVKKLESAHVRLKQQAEYIKSKIAAFSLGAVFGMAAMSNLQQAPIEEQPTTEITAEVEDQEIEQEEKTNLDEMGTIKVLEEEKDNLDINNRDIYEVYERDAQLIDDTVYIMSDWHHTDKYVYSDVIPSNNLYTMYKLIEKDNIDLDVVDISKYVVDSPIPFVYEQETRDVKIVEDGEPEILSDWKKTENYYCSTTPGVLQDTIDIRYVLTDVDSLVVGDKVSVVHKEKEIKEQPLEEEKIDETSLELTTVIDDIDLAKDDKKEPIFQDITSDQNYTSLDLSEEPEVKEGRSR